MKIQFKSICAVSCLLLLATTCGAATVLEQLQNSGADTQNTKYYVPAPETDKNTSLRITHDTKGEAIELAKQRLDKSLTGTDAYNEPGFWKKARTLREAFDNGFRFKNESCGKDITVMYTLKSEYYSPEEHKKNIIHICKGYEPDADLMAQDLIHEVSHLMLWTMENEATEFEMVITRLGGGYPVINGYINYDPKLTQEDLEALGLGYIKMALGIDSKISYDYQVLRANIIYNDYAAFLRNTKKRAEEIPELLKFTDIGNQTLKSTAMKYKRTGFVQEIDRLAAGQ